MAPIDQPASPAPLDLSACELEPIHIPGSIQPHGVLLVVSEPALRVVQASANAASMFGLPEGSVLGAELSALFAAPGLSALERAIETPDAAVISLMVGERRFWGLPHRSDAALVLELEPDVETDAEVAVRSQAAHRMAREGLRKLGGAPSLGAFWTEVVGIVRAMTGFDRVMVYRLDEHDESGEVIAEAKAEDLEPFLGLHYPASDIPAQARRLFLVNRLRFIHDVEAADSPLVPVDNPITKAPLDLTYSALRAASPVHREYLANMPVRTSMAMALPSGERLWGLVACHHRTPRLVPFWLRSICEFFASIASSMAEARLAHARLATRARTRDLLATLSRATGTLNALVEELVGPRHAALELVGAKGFAAAFVDRTVTTGTTPSVEQLKGLVAWLEGGLGAQVASSSSLSVEYSEAHAFSDIASGLIAVRVPGTDPVFLLWFRPEIVREVAWAGDPSRPAEEVAGRISPRRSFERWKETVRLHAKPWEPWEIAAVTELRDFTLAIVAQRAEEVFRLNEQLKRMIDGRDEFLSIASHELKTPMTTLRLHLELLRRLARKRPIPPADLASRVEATERQVERLEELVHRLLDVSRIRAGGLEIDRREFDLGELVSEVVRRQRDCGVPMHVDSVGDLRGFWDRARIDQVVMNLVSNAIKYGKGKRIDIRVEGSESKVICAIRDHGVGVAAADHEAIFERFARSANIGRYAGFGLGLWISRAIVEQHGGHIEIESALGQGSTFTIELPRREAELP
jgi:light-regulated signal transduction histidine kinase (bacteriophytochrome)